MMMTTVPHEETSQSVVTGAVLALLAAIGAVFAWSKWYQPPPDAPGSVSQYIHGALGTAGPSAPSPSQSGTAAATLGSHGLSSHNGSIGLIAALVLAGAILFTGSRRTRPIGAVVAFAAGAAMLIDGVHAFIPALNSYHSWNHLATAAGYESILAIAAHAAVTSTFTHSVLPSGGAAVAGAVALLATMFTAVGTITGRVATRRTTAAPPPIASSLPRSRTVPQAPEHPSPQPAVALAEPRAGSQPELIHARWCRSCNREQPPDAQFCGFCGATLTSLSSTGGSA